MGRDRAVSKHGKFGERGLHGYGPADGGWICEVCGEERPDDAISVLTMPGIVPTMRIKVRFCNDRPDCALAAPHCNLATTWGPG
jgi:hypothetical protein